MTTKNQAKLNVLTSIAAIDGLGLFRAELRNTGLKTKSLVVSQSINNGLFREVITINATDKIAFVPFEGKDHPVREGYEIVFTVNKEIINDTEHWVVTSLKDQKLPETQSAVKNEKPSRTTGSGCARKPMPSFD